MATQLRFDPARQNQPVGSPPTTTTTPFNLEDKISSLNATEIELIGIGVVNQIISHLSYATKLRILEQELRTKGDFAGIRHRACVEQRKLVNYGTGELLSGVNHYRFTNFVLDPVKDAITEAFSTPLNFMEEGIPFKLSNEYSITEGVLGKAAAQMPLSIFPAQVPRRYQIVLTVDQQLSQAQSKLVFTLTELSDYTIFSTRHFTIEEIASSLQLQL